MVKERLVFNKMTKYLNFRQFRHFWMPATRDPLRGDKLKLGPLGQDSLLCAIKEFCHEEMEALHMSQDIDNLALRHDGRRTWAPFGTGRLEFFVNRDIEHFFVKENN